MRIGNIAKVGLLIMSITLPLFGCSDVEANKDVVEKALYEKYGEEFFVDRMGGDMGESPINTNKGYAHSTTYPTRLFRVQIDKDTNEVIDNYIDVLMSIKQEDIIQNIIIGIDAEVRCRVNSYWFPVDVENYTSIYPYQYLTPESDATCVVFFVLKNSEEKEDIVQSIISRFRENNLQLGYRVQFKVITVNKENIQNVLFELENYASLSSFEFRIIDEINEFTISDITID